MPIKVGMIALGCPKNRVDAEMMLARLRGEGFEITPHIDAADVVVVNTCGFIEDAKKESIEYILEMARLKKEGAIRGIVVSGCLAQRYYEQMQQEIPEVDCVVQVGCAGSIAQAVRDAYQGKKHGFAAAPEALALTGERILTTPQCYAYLRIAEGCSNRCSYCVIPYLRGPFRSRPMEELADEAARLAEAGVKELILIAQDTTRYGEDLFGAPKLPELLRRLCRIPKLHWIRLLYCYPDRITDELIDTIARENKIVKYIDMPIQHVNKDIVRAMNRRMAGPELEKLIAKLRLKVPGIVLRTTVIVGFPGETQEQFEELAAFLQRNRFERLGVFTYSQEEGTPAAEMPGQLDEEEKRHRREILMNDQMAVMESANREKIGRTVEVMNEGYDRHNRCYFGRGKDDAPEIDGRIFYQSAKRLKAGDFVKVKIEDLLDCDLYGRVVEGT